MSAGNLLRRRAYLVCWMRRNVCNMTTPLAGLAGKNFPDEYKNAIARIWLAARAFFGAPLLRGYGGSEISSCMRT